MKFEAALFDLDGTLLDSSALKPYRDMQQWAVVMSRLHQVKRFGGSPSPDQLPALLRQMGLKIGVVTASPRGYAEQLLAAHSIPYDTLVTGSDGHAPKPDPASLLAALVALKAPPTAAFYVGDELKDVQAASDAGLISVGAGWGAQFASNEFPDVLLEAPSQVLELRAALRPFGETTAKNPVAHAGSLIHVADGVFALGRYFTTADRRHAHHPLSVQLLVQKNSPEHADLFGIRLALGIRLLSDRGWTPTAVVAVPPKPGEKNRFTPVFTIAESIGLTPGVEFLPEALRVVAPEQLKDYKSKGPNDRALAADEAFASEYEWGDEERILVVDDIHTTGAQSREAARALRADGAVDVRVMVFGKDQRTLAEKCPWCGANLKEFTNGNDGSRFMGCTQFRSTGCRYKRSV